MLQKHTEGKTAVELRVRKGLKEKQEESYTQGIACQQGSPLWMLQGCTYSREAHVIAEGVAENWPNQVSWERETEQL